MRKSARRCRGVRRVLFAAACLTRRGHVGYSAIHLLAEIAAAPEFAGCKTAEDLPPAIRTGFLNFDRKTKDLPQIKAGADHSGSTAITAFVTPTHYVVANCGAWRVARLV